jgi:hypothetical protein
MTMTIHLRRALPLVAAALLAHDARAQSLAARVAAVKEGTVELHFAGRPGICGDGLHFLSFGGHSRMGEFSGGDGWNVPCLPGPVRVRIQMEDGVLQSLHAFVGPLPAHAREPITDLGEVPARAAAEYFLHVAAQSGDRTGGNAILPAVLADSISVWRQLLAIGRDRARPRSARNDAAFWLSRFASAKLNGHAEDLGADDDSGGRQDDARASAVFALSQLRDGEGIVPLVEVARTNHDARIRGKALFWLGQSGDARGLDVMEEILER